MKQLHTLASPINMRKSNIIDKLAVSDFLKPQTSVKAVRERVFNFPEVVPAPSIRARLEGLLK